VTLIFCSKEFFMSGLSFSALNAVALQHEEVRKANAAMEQARVDQREKERKKQRSEQQERMLLEKISALLAETHTSASTTPVPLTLDRETDDTTLEKLLAQEALMRRFAFFVVCLTPNCKHEIPVIGHYSRLCSKCESEVAIF
jgi:hypothetical protein